MKERTKELLSSKWWRMNNLYKIVSKRRELITMRFNEEQTKLYAAYALKKQKGKLLRELQLKNRQIGMTTYHAIWMLDSCIFSKWQNCGIIAHEQEALEKIFRIVKTAWENMPELLKPKASLENVRELHFTQTNSTIFITLKARSGTLSHLHISEYAKIRDIEELKAGSFQAAGAGDITIEFTGQGLNHAYEDWNDESQTWTKHFFPWMEHEEYQTPEEYNGKNELEEYLDKLKVSKEQKNWYCFKLDELKDQNLMRQEYPSTPEEAFITSSRGVFTKELEGIGILEPIETIIEANCIIEVFEKPLTKEGGDEYDAQYCLGADPSGGYSDGDFSCFYIINSKTRRIAVRWHGHIAPDLFGQEIAKWGKKYNSAYAGIEVNNHGLTTITSIKAEYPDLYQRERRDLVTGDITRELGWNTNTKSKDELIDELKTCLRDKSIESVPKGLLKELKTFVRKDNGRCEAEEGSHDDEVMALGISLMMCQFNPYFIYYSRKGKYMGRET